jgi:hypothetical protein
MRHSNPQQPIWAWIVLIGGGLFLFSAFPGLFLVFIMSAWKANELGFFTILYMTIALCLLAGTVWGLVKAFKAIRPYNQQKKDFLHEYFKDINSPESVNSAVSKKAKPIWPWIVIAPGALLLISSGPGVIMLPIAPLFLAGMSTDSGTTPEYIPLLILVVGYGLMISYIILVVKAIKTLRAK